MTYDVLPFYRAKINFSLSDMEADEGDSDDWSDGNKSLNKKVKKLVKNLPV